MWLDRGELDKIIERTIPEITPPTVQRHEYDDDDRYEKRKRKPSILGDLFDF